jgi:hypothetical protein
MKKKVMTSLCELQTRFRSCIPSLSSPFLLFKKIKFNSIFILFFKEGGGGGTLVSRGY